MSKSTTTTTTTTTTSNSNKRKSSSTGKSGGSSSHKQNHNSGNKKTKKLDNSTNTKHHYHTRKNEDIVNDGKKIWNQLRQKNNTKEQTAQYVKELKQLIRNKVTEIALQHDGSRLVQSILQFGNEQERLQIIKELTTSSTNDNKNNNALIDLCKSQYAHFIVLKAMKYGNKECIELILNKLKGHIAKLAIHSTASRVIETIFELPNKQQTAILKQELYGPHFALFATDTIQKLQQVKQNNNNNNNKQQHFIYPTLKDNIELLPDKKDITIEYVRNIIHKGMEKQLYGYTYFQQYMLEYMNVIDAIEIRQLSIIAADHTIHLLTSRPGTNVVTLLISYCTAKERKRILKNLKGYTKSGLLHQHAYLAILRLIQLTDDTVAVYKNILQELITNNKDDEDNDNEDSSPLLDIALSDTGYKFFTIILDDEEDRKKLFDPYEHSILFPNPTIVENNGQEVPTSKKDDELRRQELLHYMKEPIIELCTKHTNQLLRSIPGSIIIQHVYNKLQQPESVIDSILDVCEKSLTNQLSLTKDMDEKDDEKNDDVDSSISIFEHTIGHRVLKNLILTDIEDDNDQCFAYKFLTRFNDQIIDIATSSNRGAFIIAALCKFSKKHVTDKIKINKIKKLINNNKDGKQPIAGYKALLEEL